MLGNGEFPVEVEWSGERLENTLVVLLDDSWRTKQQVFANQFRSEVSAGGPECKGKLWENPRTWSRSMDVHRQTYVTVRE